MDDSGTKVCCGAAAGFAGSTFAFSSPCSNLSAQYICVTSASCRAVRRACTHAASAASNADTATIHNAIPVYFRRWRADARPFS